MKINLSVLIVTLMFVGCSSKPKSDETGDENPSTASAPATSTGDIKDKYSILQLDSVANVLRAVSDAAGKTPSKETGTELIGCEITGQQASSMRRPLKSLIDSHLRAERDSYSMGPAQYSTERAFDICGATCNCGVLATVIDGADTSSFKRGDAKSHERWLARLKLKASSVDERASRACATRQAWFCGSDLKKYLEAQASP